MRQLAAGNEVRTTRVALPLGKRARPHGRERISPFSMAFFREASKRLGPPVSSLRSRNSRSSAR
jgi:hypothetical protein